MYYCRVVYVGVGKKKRNQHYGTWFDVNYMEEKTRSMYVVQALPKPVYGGG
jgi:hypothetical protein